MPPTPSTAWRNDSIAKVTGRAKYTDDIKQVGLVHAVPVYSGHVHARIKHIDITAASVSPGVLKILTHLDVKGSLIFGQIVKDLPMFASDIIRCEGDVIAVVVAETRAQAQAAAILVQLDAEDLPAVFDPEQALLPDAILVHSERGTNLVNEHRVRTGDIEQGFAESDFVIEQDFSTQFIEHAYMEPESALCVLRPDGVMEIVGSLQHPFSTRRFVAALLGISLTEIEIKTIPMGGGFGGKDDTASVVCARVALAAQLLKRPVKMTYDREWSVRESYKRHPYRLHYKMGFTKTGIIRAVKVRIVADAGAYCSVTPWVTWRSTVQCCGPYKVDHVWCDVMGAYTNNPYTGAMRGFGSPQVNFCIEQLIEMAAEQCGLSPMEIRQLNMLRQDDITITGQKLDNHTVSLPQVMDLVLKESDYAAKLKRAARGQADARGELYGIGMAISYRGVSLGAEGMDFNSAIINAQFDGSILLEAAVHENGQGLESAMVLIAARELGVSKERIRYRQPSTANIPDGGTTVASRGTLMGGGAIVNAASLFKAKVADVVAPELGCRPSEICFANDRIHAPPTPGETVGRSLSFEEGMKAMFLAREIPYAFGTFKAPIVNWDEHLGHGKAYFTWVYACQVAELTVNQQTGAIKVLDLWAAHDVGRAVNPPMVLGQMYGGLAMGLGYALQEELLVSEGRIQNLNLDSYRIFRAAAMPRMHAWIVENDDPNSPSGAKSIGEPTLEIMAPAVANAVYVATGQRHFNLPIKKAHP